MFILVVIVLFFVWLHYSGNRRTNDRLVSIYNATITAEAMVLAAKEANKTPDEKRVEMSVKLIMAENARKKAAYDAAFSVYSQEAMKRHNDGNPMSKEERMQRYNKIAAQFPL